MIRGIGIDLVKIERLKISAEKWGERFLYKIFTDTELKYCRNNINPYLSFAARFAAKEAMIKAVSSEASISFKDIEIINERNGKPCFGANGKIWEILRGKGIKHAHLSLSHEKEYAVAMVVIED